MSGDFDASLKIDFILSMEVSDLEPANGAGVSVHLDGRVAADGEEYLFVDESLTVETAKR